MSRHAVVVVKALMLCCTAAFILGAVACNTVEGAGRDVEAAGDAVSDTARDAKD
ncbi:MAG: entericidin A/B family lipoprotein [Phycisphaerales bacterium]